MNREQRRAAGIKAAMPTTTPPAYVVVLGEALRDIAAGKPRPGPADDRFQPIVDAHKRMGSSSNSLRDASELGFIAYRAIAEWLLGAPMDEERLKQVGEMVKRGEL